MKLISFAEHKMIYSVRVDLLYKEMFSNMSVKIRHSYIHTVRFLNLSDNSTVDFIESTEWTPNSTN
jgi:hypothetical protein